MTRTMKTITASALALAVILCITISASAARTTVNTEDVKTIVYADAGVKASDVLYVDSLETFRHDGTDYTKLVFRTADKKYVYLVDGNEKIILRNSYSLNGYHWDDDDDDDYPRNTVIFTADEAKQIAMKDAGISAKDLRKSEVELDEDDGYYYYEVELKTTSGMKYEYDINAETGEIVKGSTKGAGTAATITASDAVKIAMDHAGLKDSSLRKKEVELKDKDHKYYYYEVELKGTNGLEYEFKIDAKSGAVLSYEIDD